MKLGRIIDWLDRELALDAFDDVSNNGLQIAREGDEIRLVAFAVDGSAASVRAAAAVGAQLLVVHHGISWGGGIRRVTEGAYAVISAAIRSNLALYGAHLPLDASRKYGNNWELARFLGLTRVRPAFRYHGNVIGVIGACADPRRLERLNELRPGAFAPARASVSRSKSLTVGICSGGAGDFAPEAKALGCDVFVSGEASWGDVIAAENAGASLVCCGHYETETFGVKALARALSGALKVKTLFLDR
ncbi:MAG: Nif3-like dinuclear metal center hexameric protein [Kiritimatiellia bacterium]